MSTDQATKINPLTALKESIHALGLTQEKLAGELGITRQYFNMILNGNLMGGNRHSPRKGIDD